MRKIVERDERRRRQRREERSSEAHRRFFDVFVFVAHLRLILNAKLKYTS